MISRSQRISGEQFDSVMEKGKIIHSSLFTARIIGGQKDTRIAAVTPKKIIKTAVARNKFRRKIYEAFKKFKPEVVSGVHILIFTKSTIIKSTQTDITTDMRVLFVKAGILR